jgi:periplasmic protein CpxP/Spy
MKYVLKHFILIGFLTFSVSVIAQSKNEKFEHFKKEMDLTDAQVLKIKAIKDRYAAEKADLKNKLDELREKEIEEIDRIFTPEQKAKLKVIIERHKAQKK